MGRISGRSLWIIFVCSLLVLVVIGIASDMMTARYASSEYLVSHSHEVQTRLIGLRADLLSAEAARLAYVVSGDPAELPSYEAAMREVPNDIEFLRRLTADNPMQQQRLEELRPLMEQRLGVLRESVELVKKGVTDQAQQKKFTETGASLMTSIRGILNAADEDEHSLLMQRESFSERTYAWARGVLIISFFAMTFILFAAFTKLLVELRNREQAEEAIRKLSGRLLKVQDEERRRIARELHDSLGQLLTSVKMNLDMLRAADSIVGTAETQELLAASVDLVQESLAETRTLSYLLHPPLLDEFGFASAAKWYIEGFSARSKIEVKIDIDPHFGRMPEEVELALFRLLQESLTNIHRHSGSSTAEIQVNKSENSVALAIVDHGKGMSAKTLEKFQTTQSGLGVGLAGMRERVHQLGGSMKINSDARGTIVNVSIPLAGKYAAPRRSSSSLPPQNPPRETPQTKTAAAAS